MSLTGVEAALEARDLPAALGEALAAWRATPDPRLAALIDTLSLRVSRTRPRPTSHATWLALAARRDPADLAGLLATLAEPRKARPLIEKLGALAGRDDPRISTAMRGLLAHPPIAGNPGLLVTHAARDLLDDRPPGQLAEAELLHLAAIEQRLAEPRDAEALFAAVYANPDDDAPRSVLADLLQERGDPRGELIALQLARGEPGPRERALLRAHAREWLGAIAPAIGTKHLGFERGFVARCEIIGPPGCDLAARLEWATVTFADVRGWRPPLAPLLARMPVLRTLHGLARASLACGHPQLRMIGVELLDRADALVSAELPSLRVLEAWKARAPFDELAALWSSPRFASLERFVVDTDDPQTWIPGLATLDGPQIVYTNRTGGPWRLRFVGDRVIAEDIRPDATATRDLAVRLAELLALVPSPGTRRLELGQLPSCAELAAVTAQFARVVEDT